MVLVGTRYSTPPSPPRYPHPGYTPPCRYSVIIRYTGQCGQSNSAVGLKSVGQLTLRVHFSDFRGITEVYNLLDAGDPNDHNVIPGTD